MTVPGAAPEWTYSEYARLPDDGNRYEVIDGEVCVTPSPGPAHQKPPRYRDFGVPEYWVVDPFARAFERYRLAADAAPEICPETLAWQSAPDAPALRLNVQSIFPAP